MHGVLLQVLAAESEALFASLPEPCAALLAALVKPDGSNWSHVLAAATTSGKNLLPRAAALLGVQPVSDVMKVGC